VANRGMKPYPGGSCLQIPSSCSPLPGKGSQDQGPSPGMATQISLDPIRSLLFQWLAGTSQTEHCSRVTTGDSWTLHRG
jgi:hypothetical protein